MTPALLLIKSGYTSELTLQFWHESCLDFPVRSWNWTY